MAIGAQEGMRERVAAYVGHSLFAARCFFLFFLRHRPPATGHLPLWLLVFTCFVLVPSLGTAREVSTLGGNLLLSPNHGGDGSAWGKPDCAGCHPMRVIHREAPGIRDIVRTKGYATCAGCHGGNGTAAERPCGICHNSGDLPATPYLSGTHKHDFAANRKLPFDDGKCLICHLKSDMDGAFELDVDLTPIRDAAGERSPYTSVSDFCLRCHNRDHQPPGLRIRGRPRFGINDPLIAIEDNYRFIDRHGFVDGGDGPYTGLRQDGYRYGQLVECVDCHAMHGTVNRKLLLDDSRKGVFGLSPELRERPYRIRVRKGNSAELCVLCHAMTNPDVEQGRLETGNGLSGVHDATSDCGLCHTHGEPVKGGL